MVGAFTNSVAGSHHILCKIHYKNKISPGFGNKTFLAIFQALKENWQRAANISWAYYIGQAKSNKVYSGILNKIFIGCFGNCIAAVCRKFWMIQPNGLV